MGLTFEDLQFNAFDGLTFLVPCSNKLTKMGGELVNFGAVMRRCVQKAALSTTLKSCLKQSLTSLIQLLKPTAKGSIIYWGTWCGELLSEQGFSVADCGAKKVVHPMNFTDKVFGVFNVNLEDRHNPQQQILDDWFLAASSMSALPKKSTYVYNTEFL